MIKKLKEAGYPMFLFGEERKPMSQLILTDTETAIVESNQGDYCK